MNSSAVLLDQLDTFVGFVRSRTGDPELAADIVQESLMKALSSANMPADEEGVVTWFYRILRNAIVDHHRRAVVREKALTDYAREMAEIPSPEDHARLCQCVLKLLPALPAADAALLRRIDLEGASASEVARAENERVNTLNVRLHRARRRLREEVWRVCRTCATHGCLDCDCA